MTPIVTIMAAMKTVQMSVKFVIGKPSMKIKAPRPERDIKSGKQMRTGVGLCISPNIKSITNMIVIMNWTMKRK